MKNRSDLQRQIDKIINDKTSGSTDLLINLNSLLLKNIRNKDDVNFIVISSEKHLRHFNAITNYFSELKKIKDSPEGLLSFLKDTARSASSVEMTYKRAKPWIKNYSSILTLSYSRTVINFLALWKIDKPSLKVTVCESRPNLEGRKTAEELIKMKIRTELITDSSMGLFIPHSDAVLIGADRILKNGNVINKTGSLAAALLCRKYNKPFIVAASANKFSKMISLDQKEEDPAEVWNKKSRYLKVRNYYFEEVDKKYISRIFS